MKVELWESSETGMLPLGNIELVDGALKASSKSMEYWLKKFVVVDLDGPTLEKLDPEDDPELWLKNFALTPLGRSITARLLDYNPVGDEEDEDEEDEDEKPDLGTSRDVTPEGVIAYWEKLTGEKATTADRQKVEAILRKK